MDIAFSRYYHERTKYDPDTLYQKSQGLDWRSQPSPFKEYKFGKEIDLKPYLTQNYSLRDRENRWWQRLSFLLLCSYGITAEVPTMFGEPLYLRASPSAGGLYPAEIYIISSGSGYLSRGIYNYQARNHTLWKYWDSDVWLNLRNACFDSPLFAKTDIALAVTAVFIRSSWRYQARAYRRICLDSGHLLGNIELAGSMYGFKPCFIGGFLDKQVNDLLYLDPQQEGTLAVIPTICLQQRCANDITQQFGEISNPYPALASPIAYNYPDVEDSELLDYCHRASNIEERKILPVPETEQVDKYNWPFGVKIKLDNFQIGWQEPDSERPLQGLENTMLSRRSTRSYTGGRITKQQLAAILCFTYHPERYTDNGIDRHPDYFDLSSIQTFIAISGVEDLEDGCYYYAPAANELRQIRFNNFRQELHYLSLGQDLSRDAAAIVFHTADLNKAIAKYGDRVYRYLHLDAGHLGQKLNLAALRIGVGVSGIAGFFDDRVNEVLGIPTDEAVLYLTTLGQPKQ
jgi:SagB-type dehydrogenase family enzyme